MTSWPRLHSPRSEPGTARHEGQSGSGLQDPVMSSALPKVTGLQEELCSVLLGSVRQRKRYIAWPLHGMADMAAHETRSGVTTGDS